RHDPRRRHERSRCSAVPGPGGTPPPAPGTHGPVPCGEERTPPPRTHRPPRRQARPHRSGGIMTPTAHGRAVLALDDLLCDVAPETLAAVGDRFPAWYRHQARAATTQIHTGLQNAAARGTIDHTAAMPASQHPGWVRLSVLDSLVRWFAGTADTCIHNPHPSRPQPVMSAAWKPGLVVCGRCTRL